jgi:hypothetical protein
MKDNSPAFPTWNSVDITKGMTLRDYFATQAMQSFIAINNDRNLLSDIDIAKYAYKQADAMMEARR